MAAKYPRGADAGVRGAQPYSLLDNGKVPVLAVSSGLDPKVQLPPFNRNSGCTKKVLMCHYRNTGPRQTNSRDRNLTEQPLSEESLV
ncbi:Cytoplasmic Tyrosine-Protein Kinase Bmx [Manis pentadactyla]|nr:Cytoplasmic Tyrosine-Protein Kinase Bmx [Manis pentadactyla]